MELAVIFSTAFVVGFSGAMMPGPMLTVTITESARRGFAAGPLIVLGHGILEGALVIALALGLAAVLAAPAVAPVIALVGGLFLFYMGWGMIRDIRAGRVSLSNNMPGGQTPAPAGPATESVNTGGAEMTAKTGVDAGQECGTPAGMPAGSVKVKDEDTGLRVNRSGGILTPAGTCRACDVAVAVSPESGGVNEQKNRLAVWAGAVKTGSAGSYHRTGMHPVLAGALVSISNPYWSLWWATVGLGYITLSLQKGTIGLASFFSGHILSDLTWYCLVAAAVAGGRRFLTERLYQGVLVVCGIFLLGLSGYFIYWGLLTLKLF